MNIGNTTNLRLTLGELETAILQMIDLVNDQDQLPIFIDKYIPVSGIAEERFTDDVRASMVEYLMDRGVAFATEAAALKGDELFALAYEHAITRQSGGADPVKVTLQGGKQSSGWDIILDTFDEVERQGVVRDNILAAGAIDYIYELGEHMGVFRLVDALVLNWASGSIDVVEGSVLTSLYNYWKLRDQRMSPEERGMVYRRVLSKGDSEVLDRMIVNERFPALWLNLMNEVAAFIDKTERVDTGTTESSPVSRARIYQATRLLQYNLTEYCTGMAHIQARELHAQLEACLEILRDPEVMAYFGGNRRKSLWTVIEKMSNQEFGESPDIAALRSLAVDGNAIFSFIAAFDDGGVRQDEFAAFLEAAEAYILNYTALGSDTGFIEDEDDLELDDEDDEQDEF